MDMIGAVAHTHDSLAKRKAKQHEYGHSGHSKPDEQAAGNKDTQETPPHSPVDIETPIGNLLDASA